MVITQADRRAFLDSIRDALELLLFDIERIQEGFEYFQVLDFAAIFGYAHKKSQLPFLATPGELEARTFARHQMALRTLFTKTRYPLLLIPPYSIELKNHMRMLAAKTELARVDLVSGGYKEKLARLIKESEEFLAFVRLPRPARSETSDNKLKEAALDIGKRYFPELYVAVTDIFSQSTNTIQLLFRDKILRGSEEVLKECCDMEYPPNVADAWYDRICEQRTKRGERSNRAVQSWTDALACTYVELANQRLNSKNKIIVFIAPSGNVEAVLRRHHLIVLPSRSEIVVRNLTYCLVAFAHKDDKDLIKKSLETVKNLVGIYKSTIPDTQREKTDEAAVKWRECENWLLMRDLSVPDNLDQKATPTKDENFLAILKELYRAVSEDKDTITDKISGELSKLHGATIDLTKSIREDLKVEAVRSIKPEGRHVILEGLEDELTIPLSFSGSDVAYLARSRQRLKDAGYSRSSVQAFRDNILAKAKEPHGTPEHHLLAGHMLAVEGDYEGALSELSIGCEAQSRDVRRECLFLSAVIHRKRYETSEAIESLERALEIDGEDPRLNIEYAKALWMRWRKGSSLQTANRDLDIALDRLNVAEKTMKGRVAKELRPQIANVSAFILAERVLTGEGDADADLKTADAHVEQLRKLMRDGPWLGRFFDTLGWLNYAKAKALNADEIHEKRRLLKLARQEVERGLTSEQKFETDVTVRREHLDLIDRTLNSLA